MHGLPEPSSSLLLLDDAPHDAPKPLDALVAAPFDDDDDDDEELPPLERFERAQARLLQPARPEPHAVRAARAALGYHPLVVAVAGHPWDATMRLAWGATHAYGAVRSAHEARYARLRHGGGVLHFAPPADGVVVATVLTEAHARRELRAATFLRRAKPDAPLAAARFIDAWLCDPDARAFDTVVFDPSAAPGASAEGAAEGGARWNTWPGLRAASLPSLASTPDKKEEEARLIAPILAHIRDVVCAGDARHADWFLDYLAAIVQRPWRRTGVGVLLTGLQGAGKNTVVDFFRERVLGPRVTSHLQDARSALFGRFAEGHDDRIFIQVDEAYLDRAQDAQALKHLITGDTVRVERKFQAPASKPNYANLLLTSNSPDAGLRLPADDRRWVILRVASDRVGDHAYFDALHAALAAPDAPRAFYDALMRRDVAPAFGPPQGNANGQAARPITEHYLACRRAAIPAPRRFLSALINQRAYVVVALGAASVPSQSLYQDYVHYLADAGLGRALSAVAFAAELAQLMPPAPRFADAASDDAVGQKRKKRRTAIDPRTPSLEEGAAIERRRCASGFVFRFDYARLRALLGAAGEYDPDAFLMRPPSHGAPC